MTKTRNRNRRRRTRRKTAKRYARTNPKMGLKKAYTGERKTNATGNVNMYVTAFVFESAHKAIVKEFAAGNREEEIPKRRVSFDKVGSHCWAICVPAESNLMPALEKYCKEKVEEVEDEKT